MTATLSSRMRQGDHQNPKQLGKRYRSGPERRRRCASLTLPRPATHLRDPGDQPGRSASSVQHWMGHANLQTTMRYLHYRQRQDEADLLSDAFAENRVPKLVPNNPLLEPIQGNSEQRIRA